MKMLQNKIIENGIPQDQIISINFESMQFQDIRTAPEFYKYVLGLIKKEKKMYLFFDEV